MDIRTPNCDLVVTPNEDKDKQFLAWRGDIAENTVKIDGAIGEVKKNKTYDVVVRTQTEFNELIDSPTWLNATSVCFVGDGGTLKFTRSDGLGCKIPQTVKQIQGINSATIEVTNFVLNDTSNIAAFWYDTLPTSVGYEINGMIVNCTAGGTVRNANTAFYNCINLDNCVGTGLTPNGSAGVAGSGFDTCSNLTNCKGVSTASTNGIGIGFYGCNNLNSCVGMGNHVSGNSSGFYTCDNLTNCAGTGTGQEVVDGFTLCKNLTNCTSTATSTNHIAKGFYKCVGMVNCVGTGIGITGYSFYDCSYISNCKQGVKPSTTTIFYACTYLNSETNEGMTLSKTTPSTLLSNAWTGSDAPYTQTLSVTGVTATSKQEIYLQPNPTLAVVEAWNNATLVDGGQAVESVILQAWGEKPMVDIPVIVEVRNG